MEDLIGALGFLALIAAVIGFRIRSSFPRITILEYERGVKFRKGVFVEVLGPGCHRIHSKHERVEKIDMRPQPFLFEALSCVDALQKRLAVSMAGEILVDDARLAFTNTRTQSEDIVARLPQIVRGATARVVLPSSFETEFAILKQSISEALMQLQSLGFKVENFQLTEIWMERSTTVTSGSA